MLWIKFSNQSLRLLTTCLLCLGISFLVYSDLSKRSAATEKESADQEEPSVEGLSINERLSKSDECLPHLTHVSGPYTHYQMSCTDEAWQAAAKEIVLTETFTIPTAIARRVSFWYQIYSRFSGKEFIVHLVDQPEVILEIIHVDTVHLDRGTTPSIRRHFQERREAYSQTLREMQKLGPEEWTTTMQRIAVLMSHIEDENKYQKAADNIRTQRGQREYVHRGIEAYSAYMEAIEAEFEKRDLPVELARIAFVESSFNLRAVSKVGASGVYQIMPFIARKKMILNDQIDERRDPIKSARLAADLFNENFRLLKEWPLAVTAYNHGAYGLRRAMRRAGSNDMIYLINNFSQGAFGFASKNFYTEYLAMLLTLKRVDRHFPDLEFESPLQFDSHTVKRRQRIQNIVDQFGIDRDTFAKYNPDVLPSHVRSNGFLPQGFEFKVPSPKKVELAEHWQEKARRRIALTPELGPVPFDSLATQVSFIED